MEMFPVWFAFLREPGREADFWNVTFPAFILHHGYIVMAVFFLYGVSVFTFSKIRRHDWSSRDVLLLAITLSGAAAACYFLLKRPAGSTLFESSVLLLGLAAVMLSAVPESIVKRWVIWSAVLVWAIYGAGTFNWAQSFGMVRHSREKSDVKWAHYSDVRRMADGRPIVVVFPTNDYHHEGVFEFLLKGTADFPTWRTSFRGQLLLEQFVPRLSFRNNLGGPSPNEPYEPDTVVVWYERGQDKIVERNPELEKAVRHCISPSQHWSLEGKDEQTHVTAHACLIASSAFKTGDAE